MVGVESEGVGDVGGWWVFVIDWLEGLVEFVFESYEVVGGGGWGGNW